MSSIRITAGGHQFLAVPNEAAPRTVAAFEKLLPYRQKIIHVRWSGEACWIPLGDFDLKTGQGLDTVIGFIRREGLLEIA